VDSLTQALLGATTFAIIKDKDIGKRSLLIGAIAGTLPDLDVFLALFFIDIEFLTIHHRGLSHSILLAIVLSLILGYVFYRVYKKKQSFKGWSAAFFLAIMTHSILDLCTTYGTKLLSPFSSYLFSTNNIHVFEPFYTIILLIGTLILLLKNLSKVTRLKVLRYTLLLSTLYLSWTFVSKGIANNNFVDQLEKQGIEYEKIMVSPTPLNSVLWHGIVKTETGFYFGTYSLLDKRDKIDFQFEKSANELINQVEQNRLGEYYLDYTQDFPLIKLNKDGNVNVYAIKYGPVNYFGVPEFIFPLTLNLNDLSEDNIKIDYSSKQRGPVKDFRNLWKRIKGL